MTIAVSEPEVLILAVALLALLVARALTLTNDTKASNMAAPVISSVTPPSASLAPGGTVDVVVEASDPDSASGQVSFPVTDGQGNTSLATIDLTIDDPLTFGDGPAVDTGGLNITVQRIAVTATSATYRITAN